jgi:hypothetical protein
MASNWIGYVDTIISYYTSYDPATLSDTRWAEVYKQIEDIRIKEAKANQ